MFKGRERCFKLENVTVMLAFTGGVLAFISPCCLPLYPSFISYITGISVSELKEEKELGFRAKVFMHSLFFSVGFSVIYYILGFSVNGIGSAFTQYHDLVRMLGGIFLVFIGFVLIGVFKPKLLMREFRFQYRKTNNSYLSSFIVGLVFAAGWTPCIGPIFGAIMYANIYNPTQTFANITAYALGFCLPFILMAFFIGKTKAIVKYSSFFMKLGGGITIILGVMIYFNKMYFFNVWTAELQYFLESLFGN